MFVVVTRNEIFESRKRFVIKAEALAYLAHVKSKVKAAWLEYEPTKAEMKEAHDKELLMDFAAFGMGEPVFGKEVAEIVTDFLEARNGK